MADVAAWIAAVVGVMALVVAYLAYRSQRGKTRLAGRLGQEERLLDLTDRITQDPVFLDANVFVQGGWDLFKFGTDRYWGVYSGADTLLLYYNKTLFDAAGAPYPTADWTWDNYFKYNNPEPEAPPIPAK